MTQITNTINYIEFPLREKEQTKTFYSKAFKWEFTEWAETYLSFTGAGVAGGFNGEANSAETSTGVLIVLYSNDLEATLNDVQNAKGKILKPIFSFPGGRRFHFQDPNGNELAVWSE